MKIIEESSCSTDRIRPAEKRIRKAFFTAISSPDGPLRRAGDRRCTSFLYPNNLQSTAWHRTLLRNIVISPQLPGLFSTAYLRDDGFRRCTRVCPSLHVDPDNLATLRQRERERRLPAEVRT